MTSNKFPREIRSSKIIKILQKEGFERKRTKGKGTHINFTKLGIPHVITVSTKKSIPMGTVVNILRKAQISRERFFELLEEV